MWSILVRTGLSFKKAHKLLAKANTAKRVEHLQRFQQLYQESVEGRRTLLYLDEAHFHQDMDSGRGWALRGRRWNVPSRSPGLHAKLNWYGAYDFTNGQCLIRSYPVCNGENTADFLIHVADWLKGRPKPTLILDNSPVHWAWKAREKAAALNLELVFLPPYSPDLNPIEGLWKWMREEVTAAHCHADLYDLFMACLAFIDRLNAQPQALVDRLWPRFDLDPDEEELRVSA